MKISFKPAPENAPLAIESTDAGISIFFNEEQDGNPSMYLERPNNQNQSEISNHKPLIVNTFQDLTHFGCFLMLPKFPHIFETYF